MILLKAALAALAVTVVAAGATTPGYDAWRDPISRLASDGQPHRVAVRAAFVLVAAALGLAGAWRRRQPPLVRALLGVAAIAGVVTALAPKDLPRTTPSTLASQVHVVAALAGAAALVAAMLAVRNRPALCGRRHHRRPRRRVPGDVGHAGLRRRRTGADRRPPRVVHHPAIDHRAWRSPSKA